MSDRKFLRGTIYGAVLSGALWGLVLLAWLLLIGCSSGGAIPPPPLPPAHGDLVQPGEIVEITIADDRIAVGVGPLEFVMELE